MRLAAGQLAEATRVDVGDERHVHLLDDGMQHRKLARDVEIVLLHWSDFQTTLLPAGRLREPLAALERADFVVLREDDGGLTERARRWMRADARIWTVSRELEVPVPPGAAVAFSAIAHPEEFVEGLRRKGIAIAATRAWRDHHTFTDEDVMMLCTEAVKEGARCFLTTEKDIARLTKVQRARLEETAPLLSTILTTRLREPEAALDALEQRLRRRSA
jgi:tetraacyldisaccharide 4'-kinase